MKFFLYFYLLFSVQVHAQEYFKPIPSQSAIEWLNEKSEATDLVIHYYWATWCGPCSISFKQLNDMKEEYGDKIRIYAYSDETKDILTKYLKKKFPKDKAPFSYARVKTKDDSSQSELIHWASSYPYLFITHKQLLVWHGNPTYPKKDFELFLKSWRKGEWTKEKLSKKNSVDSKKLEELKTLAKKKNSHLKQILKLDQASSKKNREIFKDTGNYVYFRDFIRREISVMKTQEQLLGYQEYSKFEKKHLEKRNTDFKEASKVFQQSREELFYIARDLVLEEGNLQNLQLAEEIIERALKLPEMNTTYPDYNLWVQAVLHKEKREWDLAKKYNDKAIKLCQTQPYCDQFIDMYNKTKKEIETENRVSCEGFLSCTKKALNNLFNL